MCVCYTIYSIYLYFEVALIFTCYVFQFYNKFIQNIYLTLIYFMSALVLVISVLELTLFELFAKETFLVSLSFSSSIYILFQNSYQSRISNWTFFVLFFSFVIK